MGDGMVNVSMDNRRYIPNIFVLHLICLLFLGPVDAQLETTTACYGVDGCNLFQLICKGGNFIKVVSLNYGAKDYSCTNDVKGDKCLNSGGCCEYNQFDCFETFNKLHTDTVYNACAGKTSCGPLQAPFNRLSSCKNELSTYVVIQHECVTEIPTTLAAKVKHTTQHGTLTARTTTVLPSSSTDLTTAAPLSTEIPTSENTSRASSATTSSSYFASSTNAPPSTTTSSQSAKTKASSKVTVSSTSFSTTSENDTPENSKSAVLEDLDDSNTSAILTGVLFPVLVLAIIGVIIGCIVRKRQKSSNYPAGAPKPNKRANPINQATRQEYGPEFERGTLTKIQDRPNPRAEATGIRFESNDVPVPEPIETAFSGSNTVSTRAVVFYNTSSKKRLRDCRESLLYVTL